MSPVFIITISSSIIVEDVTAKTPEQFFFFLQIYLFYLFLAALGLCCCALAFSGCGERGLLFLAVRGFLIVVASLAEHGLRQLWHLGSVVVANGLQSTGSLAVAHGLSCSAACGIFRGSNRVPYTGRRILNHCDTREAPEKFLM